MSVLLKGMNMPRDGERLKVWIEANGQVIVDKRTYYEEYEAVELTDHGDLIDRDEAAHEMWMKECYECSRVYDNNGCKGCAVTRMINVIACAETAHTVIPAERSEK